MLRWPSERESLIEVTRCRKRYGLDAPATRHYLWDAKKKEAHPDSIDYSVCQATGDHDLSYLVQTRTFHNRVIYVAVS